MFTIHGSISAFGPPEVTGTLTLSSGGDNFNRLVKDSTGDQVDNGTWSADSSTLILRVETISYIWDGTLLKYSWENESGTSAMFFKWRKSNPNCNKKVKLMLSQVLFCRSRFGDRSYRICY